MVDRASPEFAALAQDVALLEGPTKPYSQDVYAAVRGWVPAGPM